MYTSRGRPRRKRSSARLGSAPAGSKDSAGASSSPLWGGADARVRATVAGMERIATDAIRDPDIVERAAEIVRGIDGKNPLAQIGTLRSWLAAHTRFLADPRVDGDVIRTPALMLRNLDKNGVMQGDCDDVATLAATLGLAVGIPARFVTLAFFDKSAPYSHVFTELQDQGGRWHQMDVTEQPERRSVQPTRRAEYPVTPAAAPVAMGSVPPLASLLVFVEGVYIAYVLARGVRGLIREVADDV